MNVNFNIEHSIENWHLFNMRKIEIPNYSLDFAHLVCNFLSDKNRNYTYDEIMDFLQISNEERPAFKVYIDSLISGETAKEVTELYTLKRPLENNNFDISYQYV